MTNFQRENIFKKSYCLIIQLFCLLVIASTLLQYCLSCPAKVLVRIVFVQGSALVVEHLMATYHFGDCNHEQVITRKTILYLQLAFYSVQIYFPKLKKYFELACIPLILHTSYYNLQKDYLFGVANEA